MLPGKTIALPEVLRILRRRLALMLVLPVTGLFVALLLSSRVPNVYQADMLIAVDPQRVPDSFVRTTVTMPIEQQLESIKVQVLSRTALEGIISEFGLYQEERQELPMEDVVAKMRLDIEVALDRPIQQRGMPPDARGHSRPVREYGSGSRRQSDAGDRRPLRRAEQRGSRAAGWRHQQVP